MDGHPILGPTVIREQPNEVPIIDGQDDPSILGSKDRVAESNDEDGDKSIVEASPLWEHTEAFRRAVILGLIFEDNSDSTSNAIFSDIVRYEGNSINVRGGSGEDLAIHAAVETGLLLRSSARGGSQSTRSSKSKVEDNNNSSGKNNSISMVANWFVRELSAPIAAIPAWHGLMSTIWREQKENKLRESQW